MTPPYRQTPYFRRVWNKQQKNLPFQNWEYQAGSQFLSVLEGNSELLQQPLMTILNIIMFEVRFQKPEVKIVLTGSIKMLFYI